MRIVVFRIAVPDESEQDLVDGIIEYLEQDPWSIGSGMERRSPNDADLAEFGYLFFPFSVGDRVNWPDDATETEWLGTVTAVRGETTVTVKLDAGGTHDAPRSELQLIHHTPLQAVKRKEG